MSYLIRPRPVFVVAAPPTSDVASAAAFLPLVLSQRNVSRHGISEVDTSRSSRRGREAGNVESYHRVADVSGKGCVGQAIDDVVRHGGQGANLERQGGTAIA